VSKKNRRESFKLINYKEPRGSYSSANIIRMTKWEWCVAFTVQIRKAYSG